MTREEAIKILEYPVKKWSMEWDEREDGLSYYEALDMAISALRQQEHFRDLTKKVEPLTNAQKIMAMSDEELAELLCCTGWRMIEQKECLEWLRMQAEEAGHER